MKMEDAKRIMKDEQLISFSFFEDRNDSSNEIVIKKERLKLSAVKLYTITKKMI